MSVPLSVIHFGHEIIRMHFLAARLIAHPGHNHKFVEALKYLDCLGVKYCIPYKVLMVVYKCRNNLASECWSSLLAPHV